MKVCVSAVLLLGFGLSWTRSQLSPGPGPGSAECINMTTPISLENKTPLLGRFNYILGFSDSKFYKTQLGLTSSFWFDVSETPGFVGSRHFGKINGTCLELRINATVDGNTLKVLQYNMSSEVQFFRISEDSILVSSRTTASNIHQFLEKLNMDPTEFDPDLNAHSIYLSSRGTVVKDSDLEQFKVLAGCLGFSGDPDFKYDPKHEFCSEEESVLFSF